MKVLFVYMNTAGRGSFPIGLLNLSGYLEMLGHEVKIFDTTFYKEFVSERRECKKQNYGFYKPIKNPIPIVYKDMTLFDDLDNLVRQYSPDIIGFSILSCHFYPAVEMADKLKEKHAHIPIIFGGLHPSIAPEDTIAVPSIDMVCIGEGEYAMAELLEKMSNKKDITSVKNIWVKQDRKIFKNEIRKLIEIEELPVLNWSLLSDQHFYTPLNGKMYRSGSVEFSRGCPYTCDYCSCIYLKNLTAPQKYLRRTSVKKSISDLIYLKNKYKLEMFYFLDESFLSMPEETLRIFAEEYKKEVDLPFYGMTHPTSVNKEKASLLKKMGCYLMTTGIECGNQEFRKKILNRNVPNNKIVEAFEILQGQGIFASAFGMIGLPYETRPLIFETIEMFRECKPETHAVGIYQPYPGSKLREICIKEGFYDPTNENFTYPSTESVLKMPQISAKEISGLYKTFFLYTKMDKEYFPLLHEAENSENKLEKAWNIFQEQSADS